MPTIPKVMLLLENSRAFGRGLMSGIADYSRLHGPWSFYEEPPFYMKSPRHRNTLSQLKNWDVDGVIMCDSDKTKEIIAMGLPVIVTDLLTEFSGTPIVKTDDVTMGKMAAEYLIDRGFRQFAFCGFDTMFWSQDRHQGFGERVTQAGFKIHYYKQPKSRAKRLPAEEQIIIADWLKSLPKPVGLMACNDDRGREVIEACRIAGLHVPEEIAVLGVDNDELVCKLSNPPLSSIALNFEKAGYDAAELLDKLMSGKEKMTGVKIVVRPTRSVTRQSTDILAIEDREVAGAMRFIRQHCKEPIQVSDVVSAVAVSRRNLYQRFRRILGRSIHQEIRRARVEQVAQMLVETHLSVSQIGLALGYPRTAHIARQFRKEKGMSLLEYRKAYGYK